MARIPRVTHKVFGSSAAAGVNGVAQPGSKQQGSPVYTTDISVIQALAAWLNGLSGVVVSGKVLPLEELNALFLEPSQQIGEILQDGIPPYDAGTTYFTNSVCSVGALLYISLIDNNTGNAPASSPSDWSLFAGISGKGLNVIRNSGMAVAQRGATGTIAAGSPAYTLDGWIVDSVGANVAWAQVLGTVNNALMLQLTPAGTLTDLYIKQRIESTLMQEIGYTPITIQAYIYNGTLGSITPTLTLNIPTSTDNYGSVTNVLAATNLQAIPAGTGRVVAYTFVLTSAYAYQNGLEVIWNFGAQVPNTKFIQFGLSDISPTPNFTAGLIANPPLPTVRQIAEETVFCKRYFIAFGTGAFFPGGAYSANAAAFVINFTIPMRAAPTLTVPIPGNLTIEDGSFGGFVVATIGVTETSNNSCAFQASTAGTLSVHGFYFLGIGGSGPNLLNLSSEL